VLQKTFYVLGVLGFSLLAFKFVAWQLVLQLSLIAALIVWVFIGGILVGRKRMPKPTRGDLSAAEVEALRASAARARYAQECGESAAAQIDKADPQFWRRVSSQPLVRK
jgi:hypothetical protein